MLPGVDYIDVTSTNILEVFQSKNLKLESQALTEKIYCILNKYNKVRFYLTSKLDVKDIFIQHVTEDIKASIFPTFIYKNDVVESKILDSLKQERITIASSELVANIIARGFMLQTCYYNNGIQHAIRTFANIKVSFIEVYYLIIYYFLRKFMMVVLDQKNERELAKVIVYYIAIAQMGITEYSEFHSWLDNIKLRFINTSKSDILSDFDKAVDIINKSKYSAMSNLINEFISFEPKIDDRYFTTTFIGKFGLIVSPLFIPSLYKLYDDFKFSTAYFVANWTYVLNTSVHSNIIPLMKRVTSGLLGTLTKELEDIVIRAHYHKC